MRTQVALLILLSAACSSAPGGTDGARETAGETQEQETVDAGADAGMPGPDASVDAGADAGPPDSGTPFSLRDAGPLLADGGTGEEPAPHVPPGFSWQMAGVFVMANDALTATPQTLKDNH